ncbi:DUF6085 family protein [Rhodococcus opacus]|nr:DUF6085 family protein [Rhodococcus opacus]
MTFNVRGYCPMGCGATLFAGYGGYIACSNPVCPNPTAVADILDVRETEHIVTLRADEFTVRHPLRERVENELEECRFHRLLAALDGPPEPPGTYRVTVSASNVWTWERVPA